MSAPRHIRREPSEYEGLVGEIEASVSDDRVWGLEHLASFRAASRLQSEFDRLGAQPDTETFHSFPIAEGYIRVAITPAPEFETDGAPFDLYRTTLNFINTDCDNRRGVLFTIVDCLVSPSNMSLAKRNGAREYVFGVDKYRLPPKSPPIILPNEDQYYQLFDSVDYVLEPPQLHSMGRQPKEFEQFREDVRPILKILSRLSIGVTQEQPAKPRYRHNS